MEKECRETKTCFSGICKLLAYEMKLNVEILCSFYCSVMTFVALDNKNDCNKKDFIGHFVKHCNVNRLKTQAILVVLICRWVFLSLDICLSFLRSQLRQHINLQLISVLDIIGTLEAIKVTQEESIRGLEDQLRDFKRRLMEVENEKVALLNSKSDENGELFNQLKIMSTVRWRWWSL